MNTQSDLPSPTAGLSSAERSGVHAAIALLTQNGYEVLHPLSLPHQSLHADARPGLREVMVCVVDTETTGPDPQVDEAIEMGGYKVIVGPSGVQVVQRLSMLEEPTIPISEEAQRVHGLSLEDVRGQRFSQEAVTDFLSGATMVVAHNAAFDARILTRRFPDVVFPPWACSMSDVDWKREFRLSSRSETAVVNGAGLTFSAHRALEDTAALTEALTRHRVWKTLLQASRQQSVQVWLENTPFESGDAIRARGGFRWNDPDKGGIPGSPKAWHGIVDQKTLPDLAAYLLDKVYLSFPTARYPVTRNPTIIVRDLPNRFLPPQDFPSDLYRQRVSVRSLLAPTDEAPSDKGLTPSPAMTPANS